jgi:hypothetical protein
MIVSQGTPPSPRGGPVGRATGPYRRLGSGPELVSAAPLAIEPFRELDLRDPPGRVQVDPLTPRAPDATPPAHKRQILEECRFDRQDVKSGHVLGAVDALEDENLEKGRIVRVRGHGHR